MVNLTTGQFYGQTNELIQLEGLTLTATEYTHDWVDWHYHQNAYFTFILEGGVVECNKKQEYQISQLRDVLQDTPTENWTLSALVQTVGIQSICRARLPTISTVT